MLQQAKENIKVAQDRQKLAYDKKHGSVNGFSVGDKVLKKDFLRKKRAGGKLDARFDGPYIVTEVLGKGLYSLQGVEDKNKVVNKVNGAYLKSYEDNESGENVSL